MKKTYTAPTLRTHGSLEEMTQGMGNGKGSHGHGHGHGYGRDKNPHELTFS